MAIRATRPIDAILPALLEERGLSLQQLAAQVGVTRQHLSRALRRRDYKTISGPLASRIAVALALPADFFVETRRDLVLAWIREDEALRERLYAELLRRRASHGEQSD